MINLHNFEDKTIVHPTTLYDAIRAAKERWPNCLILIGPSKRVREAPICVYLDMEDMADEKAVGEITVGDLVIDEIV